MKKHYTHFSQVPTDEWRWKSFSPQEIASKGEGALLIDTDALDRLQRLRDRLGKPLILTSAYRSPAHNKRVSGAKNSLHMQGVAFDVRMENHDPHEFEAAARAEGFTGFGYYQKSGFMHIDTGPARSWGKPWPKTATNWPVETPRQPETLKEDKETQAAIGAAGSGGMAVAIEDVPMFARLLGDLAPTAQLVAVCVAAAFIAYLIFTRTKGN